ncbi:MAG: DUF192 domain-containing protein [Patescibacteria group bacterium]
MRVFFKLVILAIGIAAVIGGSLVLLRRVPAAQIIMEATLPPPRVAPPYVDLGVLRVPVDIADDASEITKGLSGRESLSQDRGMLFVFANPDRYRFWMPDMHFPIDIIWIEEGKVVGIAENVSNEFDPVDPEFYLPPVPVRYVLEVNAGFSKKHGITTNIPVTFDLVAD